MSVVLTNEQIEARAKSLGPWFHNIDLHGVWTAPDHFLGDYPGVKFRRFADALPVDLSGKSVLDIGCNGGFYSIEMKRRGAARVLGIDFDEDYLAQARFAAEVLGQEIEFRQMSVYDIGALGERFDLVIFMGVLYHLRHPLLALDIIHDRVAEGSAAVPVDATRFECGRRRFGGLWVLGPGALRQPGLPQDALHRTPLQRRSDQLVGAERRLFGRHVAQRRVFASSPIRKTRCSSAAGSTRRQVARCIRRKGHGRDRSRDDLERTEQQVALGPGDRP